jgi:hypothetical protein
VTLRIFRKIWNFVPFGGNGCTKTSNPFVSFEWYASHLPSGENADLATTEEGAEANNVLRTGLRKSNILIEPLWGKSN